MSILSATVHGGFPRVRINYNTRTSANKKMGLRNMSPTIYSIDDLRAILLPIAHRYGMREVYLFGSYARGEATAQSDIDVLLYKLPDTPLFNVCGVAEELQRATGKKVDVYDISEINEGSFKAEVLKDAVKL